MSKKGMKKVDWRESCPRPAVPKIFEKGEREKQEEILMELTAPSQRDFRSADAEAGERIAPYWMPDDIGTENFDKSDGTAYLRRMD